MRLFINVNASRNFFLTLFSFFFPKEEIKNSRARKRIYELLSKAAAAAGTSEADPDQRELHFVFFRQPDRFLESDERMGQVSGVNLEKTILESNALFGISWFFCRFLSCYLKQMICYDTGVDYAKISSISLVTLGVGSGKQIAVGKGEFEDLNCR